MLQMFLSSVVLLLLLMSKLRFHIQSIFISISVESNTILTNYDMSNGLDEHLCILFKFKCLKFNSEWQIMQISLVRNENINWISKKELMIEMFSDCEDYHANINKTFLPVEWARDDGGTCTRPGRKKHESDSLIYDIRSLLNSEERWRIFRYFQ